MSSTIYCLSMIIFMEGSITSEQTKRFIADVAIERASRSNKSICEVMKQPKVFSWMWDGKNTPVSKAHLEEKYYKLAKEEIKRPMMKGRIYFNECKSARTGRRFKTTASLVKSDNLCFY